MKQSDGALEESDGRTSKQSDGKYRKDHIIKDQRKEISLSKNATQEQKQLINYYLQIPHFEMLKELKSLIQ